MKSKGPAYLLWLIGGFGILGFHRFYMGKIGTGILWLLTGGMLGIGAIIDLFTIGSQIEQINTKEELKTLRATTTEMAKMTAHQMAQKNMDKERQKETV